MKPYSATSDSSESIAASKPSVFISSTVMDMGDLRSALKWWFENIGFRVYLSESCDFGPVSDTDTIGACLRNIEKCDYFIVLLGDRAGYVLKDGKSITRHEYGKAYEVAGKTGLKIIRFIRKSLEQNLIKVASSIESPNDSDLAHQVSFVKELKDMSTASANQQLALNDRSENWVYSFSGFNEIIKALIKEIGNEEDVNSRLLHYYLREELRNNLGLILYRLGKKVSVGSLWPHRLRSQLPEDEIGCITYEHKDCEALYYFMLLNPGICRRVKTKWIDESVRNGVFLKWDQTNNTFKSSDQHKALTKLQEAIGKCKNLSDAIQSDTLLRFQISLREAFQNERSITFKKDMLSLPMSLLDALMNLYQLTRYLYRCLHGIHDEYRTIELCSMMSPFHTQNESISEENLTEQEIDLYILQ